MGGVRDFEKRAPRVNLMDWLAWVVAVVALGAAAGGMVLAVRLRPAKLAVAALEA